MAFVKSISVYEHVRHTVNYISNAYKTSVEKNMSGTAIIVDGISYDNITAEILMSAKREVVVSTAALIDYAVDEAKTQNKHYVSAQNCSAHTAAADFAEVQKFRRGKSYRYTKGKREVKAHHIIQSFKPGETTADKAHKIGQEAAFKHFGANAQILIATHVDRDHIHNHILVNSVDLKGNKITMGKIPLKDLRSTSDEVCRKHGLSVIIPKDKDRNKSKSMHYGKWLKEKGYAASDRHRYKPWQEKVMLDIDKAIVASKSYDDFLRSLGGSGYDIKDTDRKYLSIRKKGYKNFIRTYKLGDDYTTTRIKERIADPDKYSIFAQQEQNKQSSMPFLEFAAKKKTRYAASGAVLCLQYLSVLEVLFRLIVNNSFKQAKRFDVSNPYGVFNDHHFTRYLHQMLFLEDNRIKTRGDYDRFRDRCVNSPTDKQDSLRTLSEIDQTLEGVDVVRMGGLQVFEGSKNVSLEALNRDIQ